VIARPTARQPAAGASSNEKSARGVTHRATATMTCVRDRSPVSIAAFARAFSLPELQLKPSRMNSGISCTINRLITAARMIAALGACLAASLWPHRASAQSSNSGVITGVVSNANTRQMLANAEVIVEGTNARATTNSEGYFRLSDVAAGTHRVTVNYVGLDSETRTVEVTPAAPATAEFALRSGVYKLDQFIVAGEREGQARALTEQRNSPQMKSVVASDAFGDLMDNNATELLKSIPGITLAYFSSDANAVGVVMHGQEGVNASITMDGNPVPNGGNGGLGGRELNVRDVTLNNVETVEYNRAPTAADPANALGGSLNFVSKSAFSQKGRRVRLDVGMSMNSDAHQFSKSYQGVTGDDFANYPTLQLSYSEAFRQDTSHPFGVALTLTSGSSYDYSTRPSSSTQYVPGLAPGQRINETTPMIATGVGLPESSSGNRWKGFNSNFDFKLSERTTLFARASFQDGRNTNFGMLHRLATVAANQTSGSGVSLVALNGNSENYIDSRPNAKPVAAGSSSGSLIRKQNGSLLGSSQSFNFDLGAKHRFGDLTLDYDAYFGRAFDRRGEERSPEFGTLTYDVINVGFIQANINTVASAGGATLSQTSGPDYRDITNYGRIAWSQSATFSLDHRSGGKIDAKRTFNGYRFPFVVQSGLNHAFQQRDTTASGKPVKFGAGPDNAFGSADDIALPLGQFLDDRLRNRWLLRGFSNVQPGDWIDTKKLFDYATQHPEIVTSDPLDAVNNAFKVKRFKESIDAAYLMTIIRIGRVTLLPGVRYERTTDDGFGYGVKSSAFATPGAADYIADPVARRTAQYFPVTRHTRYDGWFKNAQLRYAVTPDLLLRVAYSDNIGRPNFGNLLPNDTVDDRNLKISRSNPDLKPFTAKNYDISVERYFSRFAGMATAAVFRKDIVNFTQTQTRIVASGPDNGYAGLYEGYEESFAQNVPGTTRTDGFELGYNQSLGFLPGVLRYLSANTTYNYIHATPKVGATKVVGIRPVVYNLGLTFNNQRLRVDVKYGMQKKYLQLYNEGTGEFNHILDNDRWDMSVNYRFARRYTAYFNWRNFLNEKYVQTKNGHFYSSTSQLGASMSAGIRADF
jgi:iron complex outermembrane recepter protein